MNTLAEAKKPMIRKKPKIAMIWLLPIVTLFIGLGMVYHGWQNRGTMIYVSFDNAEGLEAGKTKVKNRNVDIGVVKAVSFAKDNRSIVAEIEIEKKMRSLLHSDSQFWVVRPRIGASGISGIGTLLSGAYIHIAPGKSKVIATEFTGLEQPPVTSPTSEGLSLTLTSKGGKPLKIGNPIIYRGFEVGAIESFHFDQDKREVRYGIFIRSPYHSLVTSNTFFWNAGGMSVSTSATGLKVDIASMEAFVSGGVQFDVPEDLPIGDKVTQSRAFTLYDSEESITAQRKYDFLEYVLLVEDSVGGLYKGAPVEYRGIRIGSVHKPYLGFHETNQIRSDETRIPVVIHVEPKRITQNDNYTLEWFDKQFEIWIKDGLAARIENANFITGSLKVSLDTTPNVLQEIENFGPYTVIPIREGGLANIANKAENVLSMLEKLPLERTLNNASQAMITADTALVTLDKTLVDMQKTLEGAQPNSSIYQSLESNLAELQRTLQALQPILQEMRYKPNSLVFSSPSTSDREPKGKSNDVKSTD